MPSPFISVSRRRNRSVAPSRLTLVGVITVVALMTTVVPALGGPRAFAAASPLSIAKKALKTAKKANKKSNKALLRATRGPANESITSAKIANLTIKNEDIAPGAIGTGKIANGAIQNQDLGDGQITFNKIADGTIGTNKIADGAVTTADLAAADVHGSLNIASIPANSCSTFDVLIGGAKVGDLAALTFTTGPALPAGLTVEIIKITSLNHANMRVCNVANAASSAVVGLGIRVITFH